MKFIISLLQRLLPRPFPVVHPLVPVEEPMLRLKLSLEELWRKLNVGEDPINLIVPFFQCVNDFNDTKLLDSTFVEYERQQELPPPGLTLLRLHLANAGREAYGINRAAIGELASDATTFLGNRGGYWTKDIAYIKSCQHDTKYYLFMQTQAHDFMSSHLHCMIDLLEGLIDTAQQAKVA